MPPPNFNMARYCLRNAAAVPSKPALIVAGSAGAAYPETWTYRALEEAVLRAAYLYRAERRLLAGSRILIRLHNTSAYPIAFFGAIAAGLVPAPVSPDLTARELDFLLSDSEAAAMVFDDSLPHGDLPAAVEIITAKRFAEAIEGGVSGEFAETRCDDPAFLVYTSGTTAAPKGVLHAQRSVWGRRPMYQGWYGMEAADRLMHAGSFNWTYTLGTGLSDPWANGATSIVYTGEKDPSLWRRLMRDLDVTLFAAVPGVFRQMLKYSADGSLDLARLRHGLCAGEALAPSVAEEWQDRTGTKLYEALGQTELSTYLSASPAFPPREGKCGRPQPGRCVVILAEEGGEAIRPVDNAGLIAVHRSDPGLMLGYWKRPDEEKDVFRGEWFAGGDLGTMDEDGYIAHLGRHNELMNTGGFRVSPLEVEQQLSQHPAVSEVAVAEIPLREGVSIIAAFVVARGGAECDGAILREHAKACLASYKQPRDYIFVSALPRTPNGKVKRGDLRASFHAGQRTEGNLHG